MADQIPLVAPNAGQALEQTRVGVRNWLAELGKRIDSLDMQRLQWLNRSLASVASGLFAEQRRTAAFEAEDEPASSVPLGNPLQQIEYGLNRVAEVFGGVEAQVGALQNPDPELVKIFEDLKKALEAALEKTKHSLEGSKVAALLDGLRKDADVLDATESEAAVQTVEGLDAVLESGATTVAGVLDNLRKVADLFDQEGKEKAAAAIDIILAQAAIEPPDVPGRWETRKDLYDAEKHNSETMWERTKHEVAENRKQHHLEGHRGTAKSLSTRHSPELPGVGLIHVSDGVYQDSLTKKIYDFNRGFSMQNGEKYPGGSVANQTPNFSQMSGSGRMFESRQDKNRRQASAAVPMKKQATWTSDPGWNRDAQPPKPSHAEVALALVDAGLPPDQIDDYLGLCPLQYDDHMGWIVEALDPVKGEDGWVRIEKKVSSAGLRRRAVKDDGLSGGTSLEEFRKEDPDPMDSRFVVDESHFETKDSDKATGAGGFSKSELDFFRQKIIDAHGTKEVAGMSDEAIAAMIHAGVYDADF